MPANPMLDTASQRPATGMDKAARRLILNTLGGTANRFVTYGFSQGRYADFEDYISAIGQVWGDASADRMHNAVAFGVTQRSDDRVATAILLSMPEPDFRLAVFEAVRQNVLASDPVSCITSICKKRGIPWEFTATEGFRWTGDADVETSAMRPARRAVEDPRLQGVKSHFDSAQSELALGTPDNLRISVHESACAVEGAMTVLLTRRDERYDERDTAFKLFERLVSAEIVPQFMQYCVLAAASPRNKRGGHGAGEAPHDVPQELAEAVLASTAVAIAYLRKLLP
jgi:hypothetical protein